MLDSELLIQRSRHPALQWGRALGDSTETQETANFSEIQKKKPGTFYLFLLQPEAISGFQALFLVENHLWRHHILTTCALMGAAVHSDWRVLPSEPWVRVPTMCPYHWRMHLPNPHPSFSSQQVRQLYMGRKLNNVSNCSHTHSSSPLPSWPSGWRF